MTHEEALNRIGFMHLRITELQKDNKKLNDLLKISKLSDEDLEDFKQNRKIWRERLKENLSTKKIDLLKDEIENIYKPTIEKLEMEIAKLSENGSPIQRFEISRYKDINGILKGKIQELEHKLASVKV